MRDFFEHQRDARRRTGWLIALLALAIILITALVYVAVAVSLHFFGPLEPEGAGRAPLVWRPQLLVIVAPASLALIVGASLARLVSLRAGGRAVAESLGGRLINPDTTDPDERRVLNVVEEMAIASGTPVPPVYILPGEVGINAFAAGYRPEDAVVGVTRGSVQLLTRDELQGVIAHEFSHVLNGDMRLNLRLVGVLFGVQVIAIIGQTILRSIGRGYRGSSRSSKGGGGAIVFILALALALFVIGYVGLFIASLIKAAVSRQREFLADAAAVQFTRNPPGIAGALKKIGGSVRGSRLVAAQAEEFSHMYFSGGVRHALAALTSTHPPLASRIRRIEPQWDGSFVKTPSPREMQQSDRAQAEPEEQSARPAFTPEAIAALAIARAAVDDAGSPTPQHVEHTRSLLRAIPPPLSAASRDPHDARAVVCALLIDRDERVAHRQLEGLSRAAGASFVDLVRALAGDAARLDDRARIPLLDLCVASLRRLAPAQAAQFQRDVRALIAADDRISLFEWMLLRLLRRHLEPAFKPHARAHSSFHSLKPLAPQLALVLGALARAGHPDDAAARRAVEVGARAAGLPDLVERLPREHATLEQLDHALSDLERLSPPNKRRAILACAACIAADRAVTVREGELLRAVADSLAVPMPPILPGQPLV